MTAQPPSSANILWFLPTHGDGRYLGTSAGARAVNLGYLRQIAQAADELGYFGVLLPTGRSCEDSWVVASALAPLTERLRYLVAVRPGLQSPTVAARSVVIARNGAAATTTIAITIASAAWTSFARTFRAARAGFNRRDDSIDAVEVRLIICVKISTAFDHRRGCTVQDWCGRGWLCGFVHLRRRRGSATAHFCTLLFQNRFSR